MCIIAKSSKIDSKLGVRNGNVVQKNVSSFVHLYRVLSMDPLNGLCHPLKVQSPGKGFGKKSQNVMFSANFQANRARFYQSGFYFHRFFHRFFHRCFHRLSLQVYMLRNKCHPTGWRVALYSNFALLAASNSKKLVVILVAVYSPSLPHLRSI